MFGKGIKIFKLFGFEVRVDASWLILAVLIILVLSTGYFPFRYADLGTAAYVWMGIIGAIGLFASVIIHELCHSLVARRYGIPMKGISLFMFGGVAHMDEESRTPKGEFMMAIAGPIASFILGGLCYLVFTGVETAGAPVTVRGVVYYLAWINVVLACFNLLPAFPLDGGRILRSILWAVKKDLRWATRIAAGLGSGFGVALIVLGIFSLLGGRIVGGLWWCLLGFFLRGVSQSSYRQVIIKQILSGEPVSRFMREDPVTVPPSVTLDRLVNDYVYRHHFKTFPVVDDGRLIGSVRTRELKTVPDEEWPSRTVADITREQDEENSIPPDFDARRALAKMNRSGNSRLLVVADGNLRGIVTLKDLLEFVTLKLDIEGDEHTEHLVSRSMPE